MYQEQKQISTRKKIELATILCVVVWCIFILVDYVRYDGGKPPIFAIKSVKTYTDGEVREWFGLGYVYREYERIPINKTEFAPFWKLRENPVDRGELPTTHKNYQVPENRDRLSKYYGLLYFFNESRSLVGTYKCINTDHDCNRVVSGWDDFHLTASDYLERDDERIMGVENERYVFIDDSKQQIMAYGEPGYERTIYLFDIVKNLVVAKFKDIKSSVVDENNEYSMGLNQNYILKDHDTGKWGLIHLKMPAKDDKKTEIALEEVLAYEYDSITYDKDTGYYILCKDGNWFIYDLENEKGVSANSSEPIYDVWMNTNRTYYFKTGVTDSYGNTTFKIYNINGDTYFSEPGVTVVMARDTYFMYLSSGNNQLVFRDYSKDVLHTIPLYFSSIVRDTYTLPCFEVEKEKNNTLVLRIYRGSALGNSYDTKYLDIRYW